MEVAHGERWDPRANMASGANVVDYTYTHKNMTTTTTYTLRHAYEQDRESNNDPFNAVSVVTPVEGGILCWQQLS